MSAQYDLLSESAIVNKEDFDLVVVLTKPKVSLEVAALEKNSSKGSINMLGTRSWKNRRTYGRPIKRSFLEI